MQNNSHSSTNSSLPVTKQRNGGREETHNLYDEMKIFTGNAHPQLARDIATYLGTNMGNCEVFKFSNDNTFVKFLENIRQKDVFLIQPISAPVDQHWMELWIMIDAARRASAGRITVVIPYYAYGRTDKKDQPRVAITARLLADFTTVAGADRVLTIDLHAGQIQGFFNIPLDELSAIRMLAKRFKEKELDNVVVTATDPGSAKRAREVANVLDSPIALIDKERQGNDEKAEAINLVGEVRGKTAVIIDDEIGTGGTVVEAFKVLDAHGATSVYCGATHAVFAGDAHERLANSGVTEFVVTDTLPIPDEKQFPGSRNNLRRAPARRSHKPHPCRRLHWRHVRAGLRSHGRPPCDDRSRCSQAAPVLAAPFTVALPGRRHTPRFDPRSLPLDLA